MHDDSVLTGAAVLGATRPRAPLRWARHGLQLSRGLGALLLAGYVVQAWLGARIELVTLLQADRGWRLTSGLLLGWYLARQLRVPYLRLRGRVGAGSRALPEHQALGALGPLLLYAHAASPGRAHLWALVFTFLAVHGLASLSGWAASRRDRRLGVAWVVSHVALAMLLLALLGVHVFTVAWFEGAA